MGKLRSAFDAVPLSWKATAVLNAFGFLKVPLLFSVRPRVVQLDETGCWVRIPLRRWTKNHLGSMYFGALAIGADCVVGLLALHVVNEKQGKVVLAFKDFQAEFLKRPESDVLFVCDEGKAMHAFVDEVLASPERLNRSFPARAVLADKPEEVVARFSLTLSLKRKG